MAATKLRARLLGGFELAVDGRDVTAAAFERPSGLRLLKLLLATPGHRVRREEAAELLWPEADPERSAANLRKAIHFARRGLARTSPAGEEILAADGSDLRLLPPLDLDADALTDAIVAIERGMASGGVLDVLVRLGGRELLPGDPYEDWLAPIRERVRDRSLAAALAGAAVARAGGDRARALALLDRVLALEPADERAHRLVIELHLDAGELHAARRQLQASRRAVADAYGLEPDPALADLIEAVATERPRAAADAAAPAEAPIVGRRRELDRAQAAIDEIANGARAAGVLLRGPAGIGKSRVLRELTAAARAAGWSTLELRGREDAADAPFAPVAQAILASLGGDLPADLPEPARSSVLTAAPGEHEPPAIAFAGEAPVLRGLLDALGAIEPRGRPLPLIVDDAQWLDRGSLELVEAVISGEAAIGGAAARPIPVLVAVRDEPTLVAGPVSVVIAAIDRTGGREITVGPLDSDEIRALVERDVAKGPVEPGLATSIAELSAGTPLYAVELFRSARESRLVEERGGSWGFRRGVAALQVPEGIARLVERRISRMGPLDRIVLATAAELGDVVTFEDLVATGTDPDKALDAVDAALAAGIVTEVDGQYAFGHPLYRAALRRGLPPRDRASVHRRIADTLARGIDSADPAAVRRAGARGVDILAIANHAAGAVELGSRDAAALAVGFGIGAGERQAYLFDFAGAVTTLRRAIAAWQRLPTDLQDRFGLSAAYVELGQALRRTGDDTGAHAAFEAAMEAARNDDDLATAGSAASWLPYEHGRFGPALEVLDGVRGRIANPVARARIDSARGWILGRDGHWDQAEPILAAAVRTLEAGGPTADLMRALDRLAIATRDDDRSGAAIPILERAIHMAVELGRTGERAAFEMHLAGAYRVLGRLEEALAALDRSRGLCRLAGERYIESVVEWTGAEIEESRGDDAAAIEHRRRELAIFGEIGGNPRHEAMAHAHIAHLARRLGDEPQARGEAEIARVGALHSGIDGLEARVEWALTTDDWFAEMPAAEAAAH